MLSAPPTRMIQTVLDELERNWPTGRAVTVDKIVQNRKGHPGTYLGKRKIEEVEGARL